MTETCLHSMHRHTHTGRKRLIINFDIFRKLCRSIQFEYEQSNNIIKKLVKCKHRTTQGY